jgi:hypothetical protein
MCTVVAIAAAGLGFERKEFTSIRLSSAATKKRDAEFEIRIIGRHRRKAIDRIEAGGATDFSCRSLWLWVAACQ